FGPDLLGRSNAEFSDVGVGQYQIIIKRPGFHAKEISIEISKGKQAIVRETLEEKLGGLSITGTAGATATIAGVGSTDMPGDLRGLRFGQRYLVHVERAGYLPQDREVEVAE